MFIVSRLINQILYLYFLNKYDLQEYLSLAVFYIKPNIDSTYSSIFSQIVITFFKVQIFVIPIVIENFNYQNNIYVQKT